MGEAAFHHQSVLREEAVGLLLNDPDGIYVDCTLGGGGHAWALAQKLGKEALLIGIDQDEDALAAARDNLAGVGCRTVFVRENFRHLDRILDELAIDKVSGVLFDLGVSSWQLDSSRRGFSYMQDGPLDMRMDQRGRLTAEAIVNGWPQEKLAAAIKEYGEERWAERIAEFIVAERQTARIATTHQLVRVIKKAVPKGARQDGPHPAKRTFQALRILVNDELGILRDAFLAAANRLRPGGVLAAITFHSLEDRAAKQTLAQLGKDCLCPPGLPICVCGHRAQLKDLKSLTPQETEIRENPRARSARLRVGTKI